jgi:hypothetical protein
MSYFVKRKCYTEGEEYSLEKFVIATFATREAAEEFMAHIPRDVYDMYDCDPGDVFVTEIDRPPNTFMINDEPQWILSPDERWSSRHIYNAW